MPTPARTDRCPSLTSTGDDIAGVGLLTCLRAAGLGIADLRRFTAMLRQGSGSGDRVDLLRGRCEALLERQQAIAVAVGALDEKIAHCADDGAGRAGRGEGVSPVGPLASTAPGGDG